MTTSLLPRATIVTVVVMLAPGTALASGGGPEITLGLSLLLAPVSLVLLIVQGIAFKVVDSPAIRKGVGWTTLVLAALVGFAELFLVVSAVVEARGWPFPTLAALVLTCVSLAITAAAIYLGMRLGA